MWDCDVAIVGAGISGLSTAYYLHQRHPEASVLLLELRSRPGGLIGSAEEGGFHFEEGPDSLVSNKPQGIELACRLGLEDQLVRSYPNPSGALLWCRGRLHRFPVGILMQAPIDLSRFAGSTLLSEAGRQRALQEPGVPAASSPDESVHDFFTRRFGSEMAELLAAPLVAGVYGGDSCQISLRATFPALFEAERRVGFVSGSPLGKASMSTSSPFVSFRRGLGQLVEALAAALEPACRFQSGRASEAVPVAGGFQLCLAGGRLVRARNLVVATQAPDACRLLSTGFPEVAGVLAEIPYTPSVIGCFGFNRNVTEGLEGSGLLVPPNEDPDLLAATWVHQKFPGRCPPGKALVRCFLGSEAASRKLRDDDQVLVRVMLGALERMAGIQQPPCLARVFRWPQGLPQYTLGHLDRIARLEDLLEESPGLFCVGNYFDGVGISDAIRRARETAAGIAGRMP